MKSDRGKELFRIRAARKMGREQFCLAGSEVRAARANFDNFDLFALVPFFARSECEKALFTITAEILARSLANFYRQ